MGMNNFPILIIALPLCSAFSISLLGLTRLKKFSGYLALGTVVLSFIFTLSLGPRILSGEKMTYLLGSWPAPIGISLSIDGLSYLLSLVFGVLVLLSIIYSLKDYEGSYFSLTLILYAGMNGVVFTRDLFNLYVFWEILSISAYILVVSSRPASLRASLLYLFLGSLATTLFLLGIGIIYALTGTFDMNVLAGKIPGIWQTRPLPLALAGAFVLISLGIKSGVFPMYIWVPEAHSLAPTPTSVLLSGAVLKVGIYILIRLFFTLHRVEIGLDKLILYWGVASMIFGGCLALVQEDLKRMLAYSSISQIGIILIGIGLGTELGIQGSLYHLFNHALIKASLFFSAGMIIESTGKRRIGEIKGRDEISSFIRFSFLMGALAIIGVPPLNGFISKWLICKAAVEEGNLLVTALVLIFGMVTAVYYLRVVQKLFTPAGIPQTNKGQNSSPSRLKYVPITVLLAGCLVFGLLPSQGLYLIKQAVTLVFP